MNQQQIQAAIADLGNDIKELREKIDKLQKEVDNLYPIVNELNMSM